MLLQDHPVNSTECKLEKENKCAIVTSKKREKECRKILKKQCEEVTEVVTEIKEVFRTAYNVKIEISKISNIRILTADWWRRRSAGL